MAKTSWKKLVSNMQWKLPGCLSFYETNALGNIQIISLLIVRQLK